MVIDHIVVVVVVYEDDNGYILSKIFIYINLQR